MSNASSRIEEIRRRAAAAIRGPWFWGGNTESNTIHLATRDRGRLYILGAGLATEEYIYDHAIGEGMTIEDARLRLTVDPKLIASKPYVDMSLDELRELAEARGLHVENTDDPAEPPIEDDFYDVLGEYDEKRDTSPGNWWCDAHTQERLARFFASEVPLDEGQREFHTEDEYGLPTDHRLTRYARAVPELRFPGKPPADAKDGKGRDWDRHQVGGYMLTSYRDLARYEVLGGRTVAEHEAAGGKINGEPRHLYRQDIVGIDNPEADFIAHARDDVDYLLDALEEAAGVICALLNGEDGVEERARHFLADRLGEVAP